MIEHLSDYMSRVKGELKLISKHASMVTTQVEQVLKAQNDFLNELNSKDNNNAFKVGRVSDNMARVKDELKLIANMLLWLLLKLRKYSKLKMICLMN